VFSSLLSLRYGGTVICDHRLMEQVMPTAKVGLVLIKKIVVNEHEQFDR
jgi:hypothetical protein